MPHNRVERLEAGGNVFELIEFTLDRQIGDGPPTRGHYGVNVAKVREVVRMPIINPLASSISGVTGVFELRGIPIPAINLAAALGDKRAPIHEGQQIIVTEFSQKRAGFIVQSTHRIRRIAWEKVLPPAADKHTCINGMTLIENNEFLFILDLEKVLFDIETLAGFHPRNEDASNSAFAPNGGVLTSEAWDEKSFELTMKAVVLLVDDSDIILNNVRAFLERCGYRVYTATDGMAAQKALLAALSDGTMSIDIVVTDVEMPRMDGLSLTKWIKQHPSLKKTPVILHTSLSGHANHDAGKTVGANDYVVKNDLKNLVDVIAKYERRP